ncbi:MAG: hypothetical protein KDM81_11785 [Verrucomicrobiae bacterium]|nr:hypothetical protein [Verrucomicrobiae bacterium]
MKEKLAILVPDGAYPLILDALLTKRRESLGLRPVLREIVKDTFHDSSREVVALLRPYLRECSHVLLLRDLEGSGAEERGATALERELLAELVANGWHGDRAAVLVVEPEVEAWLRFDSVHLGDLIRERARRRQGEAELLFPQVVAEAIESNGGMNEIGKPRRPKETLEAVLELFGVRRSNAIYGRLAEREGLRGCKVRSFQRLVATLQEWFAAS